MNTRITRVMQSGYADVAKTAFLTPASGGPAVRLIKARMVNKSGGAADLGVARKFSTDGWKLFTWVDATTTATDVTATVQAGGTVTIFDNTNNDGFIIQSPKPFSLIGLTVSQAPTGGSPVYEYKYWNGSTWTTLTTTATPGYATGDKVIAFNAPMDWAVGGSGTGLSATQYQIRVRATTAPSSNAAQVTAAWVGQFIDFLYQVANNAAFEFVLAPEVPPLQFEAGEGVLPYFGSANAANCVHLEYVVQF